MSPTAAGPAHVLLVDDEPAILQAVARALRAGVADGRLPPLRTEAFADPAAALARAVEQPFALAISDFRMPGMNGSRFLARLRELQPGCRRVMLSAHADHDGLSAAINEARVSRFLDKPWCDAELLAVVAQELAEHRQALQATWLAERLRRASAELTPQEAERLRLERLEPGITEVQWSSDGAYVLEPLSAPGAMS
ncbi:response regulator [Pelomonas sp. HMWF004]|nr:response regulator [Pelomonas sp. HMWF004]